MEKVDWNYYETLNKLQKVDYLVECGFSDYDSAFDFVYGD